MARKKISLGLRKEYEALSATPENATRRALLLKDIYHWRKLELQEYAAKKSKQDKPVKKKVDAPQASVNPGVMARVKEQEARIKELEAELSKPKEE